MDTHTDTDTQIHTVYVDIGLRRYTDIYIYVSVCFGSRSRVEPNANPNIYVDIYIQREKKASHGRAP